MAIDKSAAIAKKQSASEALDAVVSDIDEKDYIACMIEEEGCKDFDSLWDLIQDFLIDFDEDNAKVLCKQILERICPEWRHKLGGQAGNSTSSDAASQDISSKIKKPIQLSNVIQIESQGNGFTDDFMGLGEKKANYNEVVEIGELVAKRRADNVLYFRIK